jgi:hypothetical protein
VLYDDPGNTVLGPIARHNDRFDRLYDFDLMMKSGHITGYHVSDGRTLRSLLEAFERLADPDAFDHHYQSRDVVLFAVGDGNHSLAAAKTVWEETKKRHGNPFDPGHPGRYALVELVNIHDPGLTFEAIHRVIFKGGDRFVAELSRLAGARTVAVERFDEMLAKIADQTSGQRVGLANDGGFSVVTFDAPTSNIAAGTVQTLLDDFLSHNPEAAVDYIHGEETTLRLGRRPGNLGVFLPTISKSDFFQTIVTDGCFPRKTFSMGEAEEKRFYLEARRILPDE